MKIKLILAVTLCLSFAALPAAAQNDSTIPNRGVTPAQADGLGRLDLRVFDSEGRPVRGA